MKKTRQERIAERNKKLLDKYKKLRNIKEFEVPVYTTALIYAKLANEFNLSEFTIEQIIKKELKK